MIKPYLTLGIVAALTMLPHATALAQGGPPPGGRMGPPAAKSTIDFATAQKLASATKAAAVAAGANVAIAVVDSNGDLVYFERMDGAMGRAITSSQGKARAALLFGVPTKQLQDAMAAGKPLSVTITSPAQGANELTPMQGGLPVMKDGKAIAAIGVGGSSPANDEKLAQAGIDTISK
jgi:glc operon protein GlcG